MYLKYRFPSMISPWTSSFLSVIKFHDFNYCLYEAPSDMYNTSLTLLQRFIYLLVIFFWLFISSSSSTYCKVSLTFYTWSDLPQILCDPICINSLLFSIFSYNYIFIGLLSWLNGQLLWMWSLSSSLLWYIAQYSTWRILNTFLVSEWMKWSLCKYLAKF